MEQLLQQIELYKQDISNYTATTAQEVEAFRIKYLGTKGLVKDVMGEMKNVPNDQKKQFGLILNEFKLFAEVGYRKEAHSLDWTANLAGDYTVASSGIGKDFTIVLGTRIYF